MSNLQKDKESLQKSIVDLEEDKNVFRTLNMQEISHKFGKLSIQHESISKLIRESNPSSRKSSEYWNEKMTNASVNLSKFSNMFAKVSENSVKQAWIKFQQNISILEESLKDVLNPKSSNSNSKIKESAVQTILNTLHESIENSPLLVIDTSTGSRAPTNPHHKFDNTFVSSNSSHTKMQDLRVEWYEIVAIEQLKRSLSDANLLREARIQLSDGFYEIMMVKQIERNFIVGYISDGINIQFYHIDRSENVTTSDLLSFLRLNGKEITEGFKLYFGLRSSTAEQLGLPNYPVLSDAIFKEMEWNKDKTVSRIIHYGGSFRANVFHVTTGDHKGFVVKQYYKDSVCYSSEKRCFEVIANATKEQITPRLVRSLDTFASLVVTPHTNYTLATIGFSKDIFQDVLENAKVVLDILHKNNIIHMDMKPENILIRKKNKGKYEILVNDFGSSQAKGTQLKGFVGTHAFAALPLQILAHNLNGIVECDPFLDFQSLFITLLEYCWVDKTDTKHRHSHLPWVSDRPLPIDSIWKLKSLYLTDYRSTRNYIHPDVLSDMDELYRLAFHYS